MNDKNCFLGGIPENDPDDYGDAFPMPRTHEMIESRYLKKEDVGRGVLATVSHFDQANVALDGQPEKNRWLMFFKELDKPLVLNSTNIQLCELAFGSDNTDDWVGKKIVLYNDPHVSMSGKLVGGIRVRAPKVPARAPRQEPLPPPRVEEEPHPFSDMEDDIPF